MVSINKQVEFYNLQLSEIAKEWDLYYNNFVTTLLYLDECFLGELYGFDEVRGQIIIRFPKDNSPRLDQQFSLLYFNDLNLLYSVYKDFYSKVDGVKENSVSTVYFIKNESAYSYLAVANIPYHNFIELQKIKDDHDDLRKSPIYILLGKVEPPIKYLLRLRHFTMNVNNKSHLKISISNNYTINIFKEDKENHINEFLKENDEVFIQGPPGTGKSYLVANYIVKYLKGAKVCITSHANKALIELCSKLKNNNSNLDIYKTNLTVNEKKEFPFIKSTNDLVLSKTGVLLTTYYKLSELIVDLEENKPIYDFLIIEEASQAFFSTIKAFKLLAKKIIVVGDPMQLPPIVLNKERALEIDKNMGYLINGMETLMKSNFNNNFLLNETYRLNKFNTKLTNVFYRGSLISRNDYSITKDLTDKLSFLLKNDNMTNLWLRDSLVHNKDLVNWSDDFESLLFELESIGNPLEIAVLLPYKDDARFLQEKLSLKAKNSKHKLLIETIDRVQGITVDITFLVINLKGNPHFVFDSNRFNVATSRSRIYNFIVVDKNYEFFIGTISKDVKEYLNYLKN